MRSLQAHQLTVLDDAILILIPATDTAHNYNEGKGSSKEYGN